MTSKFSISWNKFQGVLTKNYEKLKESNDFSDITLVSDDEISYPAHKFVLAGSSPFFRNILRKNTSGYPLLYLSGVSSLNIQYLLDFMYQGQVEIEQDHLDQFLAVGQKFRIEGLLRGEHEEQEKLAHIKSIQKEYLSSMICENEANAELELEVNVAESFNSLMEKKRESEVTLPEKDLLDSTDNYANEKLTVKKDSVPFKQPKIYCYEKVPLTDESQIKPKVEELTEKIDGQWRCKFCGKTTAANKRNNHNDHVESHFEGLSFQCSYCPKTFKTRNSQRTHKYRDHKDHSQLS